MLTRGSDAPAGGYAERTARLFQVAGLLKQYADKYQLAVVVTNQVSALLINTCSLAEMCKPLQSMFSLNFMLKFFSAWEVLCASEGGRGCPLPPVEGCACDLLRRFETW